MTEPRELVQLDAAQRALVEAETIDEIKDIMDKAEALRLYTKKARLGLEAQNQCADIKIQAERKAGALLKQINGAQGARTDLTSCQPDTKLNILDENGIAKKTAHRWQLAAELPDEAYEQYKAECAETEQELTSAGVRRLAARQREPAPTKTPPLPAGKYRCIVLDPPWPVKKIEREERPNQGRELGYPSMSLDEITALPVENLADESGCHLYLWVTQKYLPAGLDMVKAWGFNYQCLMTWRKNVGFTPFSWMYDTEHVIFATRGGLTLIQKGLRLSFDAAVNGHSVKPDVFYNERVILASPEPRLEMFARREREGFQVWGNEVNNGKELERR